MPLKVDRRALFRPGASMGITSRLTRPQGAPLGWKIGLTERLRIWDYILIPNNHWCDMSRLEHAPLKNRKSGGP